MHTATDATTGRLDSLRDRRRALRGEIVEVGHWRRLLRAKIDLTVSRGAGPRPLRPADPCICGEVDTSGLLALDLPGVCRVPEDFSLGALPQMRSADARLARYEVALREALMETTDELVKELTDPSSAPA